MTAQPLTTAGAAAGPLDDQLAGTGLSETDGELIAGRNAVHLFRLGLGTSH